MSWESALAKAIEMKAVCVIEYVKADGTKTSRSIEPQEVKGDTLFAIDQNGRQIKQFKLARIEGFSMTAERFGG